MYAYSRTTKRRLDGTCMCKILRSLPPVCPSGQLPGKHRRISSRPNATSIRTASYTSSCCRLKQDIGPSRLSTIEQSLYRLFNFARADTSNLLSANHLREGLSSHHDVAMQGSPSRPSCMKREIRHADSAAHATPPVGEAPSRQGQAETAFVRS